MSKLVLNDDVFEVVNPLPEITLGELYERANVPFPRGSKNPIGDKDQPAFKLEIEYGNGADKQVFDLEPKQSMKVPANAIREVLQHVREQGAVVLKGEPTECYLDGLRNAADFWNFRGKRQVVNLQRTKGHNEEERRVFSNFYDSFVVASVREDLIEEEIKKLSKRSA